MKLSRRLILGACAVLLSAAAQAQEPIRFARTPDISPDGKLVAFSYLGDIWTVETIGGIARPVTMHEAHDIYPCFSPDGRWIAFSSNRHGSYDVFVVAAQGGKPRRLTFDSATDVVNGWSPDGKTILFTSTRSMEYPASAELYSVPFEGGRVRRITVNEGREGVYSPRGDQIAYVRGPGLWYRKGYRGSANDDIWISDADGHDNRQLTKANCQDNSPMWSADGQYLYYVSEVMGTPANIVKQDANGRSMPQLMTFHKEDGVRKARISRDGEWIVYECGADLWVASTHEGYPPRKLAIEVNADDKTNPDKTETFTSGATEFALTADEEHVAFVVRGDIFLMPIKPPAGGGKVALTRLTDHPAYDHGIALAPDGSKMLFLSDRNGHEDIYLLEPEEAGKKLWQASQFKIKQLTDTSEPEMGISFAPDGNRVAFVRAGKLWTMKPDGTDQKLVVSQNEVIDYEWSPDSKWLAFARMDGSSASEVYIMPAEGGEARNVTRYATYNSGITWSTKGMKLAFLSERRNIPGMYVLPLQKPTAKDAAPSSDIDWDDIHLRVEQPVPLPAREGAISPDGSKIAFRSAGGSTGDDLYVAGTNRRQLSRVTTSNAGPQQIQWSKRYTDVVYFRDRTGHLRMARMGLAGLLSPTPSSSADSAGSADAATIPFRVKMTIRRAEEYQEIFDQSWRYLSEHFYDAKFHGVDWNSLRNKYRPLVKHCALKEDLYALISLLLGELNASHLGISGVLNAPDELTAELGLIFDDGYRGPGYKIAEVIKRGPADKRGLGLKKGDIILAVDGTELTEQTSLSKLLNGKTDEIVSLQVVSAGGDLKDPKARRKVETAAVGRETILPLMYDRWVQHNAARVKELSGGKLGYIHIPSMSEAGLDQFVRSLYSDNLDKEAIVLDVRYNSGGFTHDQVLNYLGAREHTVFRHRDGAEGWVLRSYDRKWNRPLVLLINNRSFSDAEIFPSAFRTLGLGKLVGQTTGGMVIGTISVRLIDGSQFQIPRTGVYTLAGVNMEREGVAPDVVVENNPDQLALGHDAQLDKAVDVLKQTVVEWKKNSAKVAVKPEASKSPDAPVAGSPPTTDKEP